MRKSQIVGQVFIYILAIVIFSLVLLYGYRAIKDFILRSEDIAMTKLKTDTESAVKKISSDYGSVKKKELIIPSGYEEICFVDSKNPPTTTNYSIITDSINAGSPENMFLCPDCTTAFDIGCLEIDPLRYVCIKVVNSRVVIRLEGTGSCAKLSKWETPTP